MPKMTPAFDEVAPIDDASPDAGAKSVDCWPHYKN